MPTDFVTGVVNETLTWSGAVTMSVSDPFAIIQSAATTTIARAIATSFGVPVEVLSTSGRLCGVYVCIEFTLACSSVEGWDASLSSFRGMTVESLKALIIEQLNVVKVYWVIDFSVLGSSAMSTTRVAVATLPVTTTTTVTPTSTATMTASSTTTLGACVEPPVLRFGLDHSNCSGLPHGSDCAPRCTSGYTMQGQIVCHDGAWQISGECLRNGVPKRRVKYAIQMTFWLGTGRGRQRNGDLAVNLGWALSMKSTILRAIARTLGLSPSNLRLGCAARHEDNLGDARRRLALEPGQVEMQLTAMLDGENLPAVQKGDEMLAQMLGDCGNGSTCLEGSIVDMLKEEGAPVPEGLALMESGAPPAVLRDFMTALSEWSVGEWGACSVACGAGLIQRAVECLTGDDVHCEDVAKPAASNDCTGHAGCAFEATCPLGHDSALDCASQAGILGLLAFVFCSCIGVCSCRWVVIMLRPPEHGSVTLRGQGGSRLQTSFRVHRPQSADGEQVFQDGKTHVVWDLECGDKLELFFAEHGSQITFTETDDNVKRSMSELSHASHDFANVSPSAPTLGADLASATTLGFDDGDIEGLIEAVSVRDVNSALALGHAHVRPAYKNGAPVEYFSTTLGRWLPGVVVVVPGRQSLDPGCPMMRYDVCLVSGQTRVDVGLNEIRPPLQEGELVEVFVRRGASSGGSVDGGGGRLLPGRVLGQSGVAGQATMRGYRVEVLAGAGAVIEAVPASRLRRFYASGQLVMLYRGPSIGWVQGQVLAKSSEIAQTTEGASPATCVSTACDDAGSLRSSNSLASVGCEPAGCGNTSADQFGANSGPKGVHADLWSILQVACDIDQGGAQQAALKHESIPTYLVSSLETLKVSQACFPEVCVTATEVLNV